MQQNLMFVHFLITPFVAILSILDHHLPVIYTFPCFLPFKASVFCLVSLLLTLAFLLVVILCLSLAHTRKWSESHSSLL
jgi:hypothetical protein